MLDLTLLQLARVKGLLSSQSAAESLDLSEADIASRFQTFADQGLVAQTPRGWRLTPEGRNATAAMIVAERQSLDQAALAKTYDDFCAVNDELKATITAWQLRDDSTPNDHSDSAYDGAVINRLASLHQQAQPVLSRIASLAPRLAHFGPRLQRALDKINAGEHSFVARPITDSYHTVWFELHEDLMAVAGLSRAEEAAAGRAQ